MSKHLSIPKYKKVGIILKSGKEIRFECENFTWEIVENEITSYKIIKFKGVSLNFCRISEIAAIITYK